MIECGKRINGSSEEISHAVQILWHHIRDKKMLFKFRREGIGCGDSRVADTWFVCRRLGLGISVDMTPAIVVSANGVEILVISANDVISNIGTTKRLITDAITARARKLNRYPLGVDRCLGFTHSGLFCRNDSYCVKQHDRYLF